MGDDYENTPGVIETVYKVWSRFKKMLRNCSNHDISRHIQVHTFYHGLTDGVKDKLDHPNGDSFLLGTTTECHNLPNNLVANHYEKNSERATPSKAVGVIEVDQVIALNAKIDFLMQSMKNFGINQVQLTFIICEECEEGHPFYQCSHSVESIQFVNNARKPQNNPYSNTYNPGWRQHLNFSWNNNQWQGSALRFQQGVQQQGSLSSNTKLNPRQDVKAQCQPVTLHNGRSSKAVGVIEVDQVIALNAKIDFLMQSMKNFGINQVQLTFIICEECEEGHPFYQCSHSVESIQFVNNARKPQNNPYSNTYNPGWRQHLNFSWNNNQWQGSALRFQQGVQQQGSLSSNTKLNPRQDVKAQCQPVTLHNGRELQEVVKEPINEKGMETAKAKIKKIISKYFEVFKKLHINISFGEALEQMPSYIKFMKDILSKKRRLGDYETVALTEECSAIIQNKLPTKLNDPGSFTIPSTIGLGEAKPTSITFQLVDRSLTNPKGVIEDILVKVDKFIFPADFIVLDMEADNEIPIILGRPFLATGKEAIAKRPLDPLECALLDLADEEDLEAAKTLDASKFSSQRELNLLRGLHHLKS
ncbi:hypothetical protein CDL12_02641 [Handroanthus impetiginosus]|uniref:Uncharacterized protein n=1 Tax=Handroanthus impetiginosus TaxID=429701 RepID=A0A2G9I4F0_9LAMI|nr:hypothetical protein CDL12_02641 [Handroanthus impetiginosus]